MKVVMWYNNSDIRIEEMEKPIPKNKEIMVKVHACGICGSDLAEWYRLPRAPLVQGHEMGGEVAGTGPGITNFRKGDRVFVAPKIGCLKCKTCLKGHESTCPKVKARVPGAFAEFVCVPEELENTVFKIPDDITYETATFIEPLACVIRSQKLAGVRMGDSILVIGSGISGLLHIKLAKAIGAEATATDVNEKKLEYARKFGAETEIRGRKFDVVIVTAAALKALELAWDSVDLGGTIVLFTVPSPDKQVVVPINDFWRKEVRIVTSYYCSLDDLKESMVYLFSKKITVEEMITHRFPLEKTAEGFSKMMEGSCLKVIIEPQK